ncbi:DUF6572 domain-containing protein [Acanthopleuribacter pedis]|nr:DUF6572 domain-containing protein [Acanthopleuribacter pedis]
MTILEADKVDFIGVDRESGKVVLTISDHLHWNEDPDRHEALLRTKIASYRAFIESGNLVTAYPDAEHRDPVINLMSPGRFNTQGRAVYEELHKELKEAGIELRKGLLENY